MVTQNTNTIDTCKEIIAIINGIEDPARREEVIKAVQAFAYGLTVSGAASNSKEEVTQ